MSPRRIVVLLLSAVLALATPLSATWSILIVDTATGEVAIASATCLVGVDLRALTPVVVVGRGVAVAQAYVDLSGANRLAIRRELERGTPPARILQSLASRDPSHHYRQYAILDTSGRLATFTGSRVRGHSGVVTGRVGSFVYSIQGNLLAGQPVLLAAEQAVRATQGDAPARLMAAMQAARRMGGDGRCSCDSQRPTSCGSPPPSFRKSAHVGYVIVARDGDVDGPCDPVGGCAQGSYYLNLDLPDGTASSPDPVEVLQRKFDVWRANVRLRPDHVRSAVELAVPDLPADGSTTVSARVVLRDFEGVRLGRAGARIEVASDPSSTAAVRIGAVTDNGDGTYEVPITSGTRVGLANLRFTVHDNLGRPVLLTPRTSIVLDDEPMWVSRSRLSIADGGAIGFVLNPGPRSAGRAFVVLASLSGSAPGTRLGPGLTLPLNPDPVFFATVVGAFHGQFPHLIGIVPASGRSVARIDFPSGAFGFASGKQLTFAHVIWLPLSAVSNPVVVDIVR